MVIHRLSSILIPLLALNLTIVAPNDYTRLSNISPDTIEFAWDAHEVLLKPNVPQMVGILLKNASFKVAKMSTLLAYDYARYFLHGHVGSTYRLMSDIYTLIKRNPGGTGEEYKIILDVYDPSLWSVAEQMAAAFYPMPGIEELLQELKHLGYTQRIATNMGPNDYKNLAKKYPTLFNNLTGGLTVDFNEKPIIRKPSLDYFNRYYERYNPDHKKTIIFIDDNELNVKAAQETGMIALVFKNIKQLRTDLKKLGLPIK